MLPDDNVSAYKGRKCPGYPLLARGSRGSRELEPLIGLVGTHPIRIKTVNGGAFDRNTHEGGPIALLLVAIASSESGHKANHIKRANRQKAGRGDGPLPPSGGKSRLHLGHEGAVGAILCSARIPAQRA